MRLTLRGLLAYLDDRLDPAMAAQVGDYIQEHDKIRQLTDRIKRVVRRRRLSTPDVAERSEMPVHYQDDPNEVAAFLDGKMTEEQEADFEEICLDTDVYLAEVAACHQIMTYGHETVKVPPLAKQRMINLVKGPEAQPLKVVPRESRPSKPPLWEVTDSTPAHGDEENQALLEPLYHNIAETRWRRGLLAVAGLLLAAFVGYIAYAVPWGKLPSASMVASAEPVVPAEKQPAAVVAKEIAPPNPEVVKPQLRVEGMWPVPVVLGEKQPGWQSVAMMMGNLTGMAASRPALPFNVMWSLGEEPGVLEPLVPLPAVAKARPRVPAPERTSHVPVAVNGVETVGMFLHQNQAGEWRITKPQGQLFSNEKLMALPGYTGNISLGNGVRIILMGQFHSNLLANPFAEAIVELHPTMEAEADVTLHRGRLVIMGRNGGQPSAVVRLRYQGETWEITLPSGSEVGVQAGSSVLPFEGEWTLEQSLELIASKGQVEVKRDEQVVSLSVKQRLQWKTTLPENQPAFQSELGELPIWLAKYQTAPKEAVESLVALRGRTHAKLQQDGRDMNWFALACDETLEEGKLIDRQAALLGLSAIDRMQPILTLQNDAQANGRRKFSHDVVRLWLNQEVNRVQQLHDLLKEAGYSEEEAKVLLSLYRGTVKATPSTLQALLQDMSHPRVAIREQAWQVLSALVPERPNIFDPAGPEEQRTKAISVITGKIGTKKGEDILPP